MVSNRERPALFPLRRSFHITYRPIVLQSYPTLGSATYSFSFAAFAARGLRGLAGLAAFAASCMVL